MNTFGLSPGEQAILTTNVANKIYMNIITNSLDMSMTRTKIHMNVVQIGSSLVVNRVKNLSTKVVSV